MEIRYRMQSLKTGWGIEGPPTPEGKKKLEQIRKDYPDMYKFCRVYLVKQLIPFHHGLYVPFRLISLKEALRG